MNRKIRYASLLSLLGALALSPAALAQHAAGAGAMFAKVDANHDGSVTAEEMKAGHAAMGEHREHAMGEDDKKGCCDMPCCDKMEGDKMKHDMKDHDMGADAGDAG